jgi:hypothetical protein
MKKFPLLALIIMGLSCSKKDSPHTDPVNNTGFNPQVTLIAGSITELGSTTNTTPLNARFGGITKLLLDTRDNKNILYLIDQNDADLRIIDGNNVRTISNVVGVYALAQSLALAPGGAGIIYITSGFGQLVQLDVNQPYNWGVNPKVIIDRNVPNGNITGVGGTRGLAVGTDGNVYLGNSYINAVTLFNPNTKQISPFAGVPLPDQASQIPPFSDGNATSKAVFGNVSDLAISSAGKLYIADRLYRTIRKVDNGNVSALFTPSPYPYENYIQQSVDGPLDKARSGMIRYVAIPANKENRIFFATSGVLRVILLDEQRVESIVQFSEGIHGIAPTPDGKTVYIVRGNGVAKIELNK